MKNLLLYLLFVLGAFTSAQNTGTALQGTKFGDNWSIGINAGATLPLTHRKTFLYARPAFWIWVAKQLTPIFRFRPSGYGI